MLSDVLHVFISALAACLKASASGLNDLALSLEGLLLALRVDSITGWSSQFKATRYADE